VLSFSLPTYQPFFSGYISVFFFFLWRDFAKFPPEKYDFDLYKGFFMEKMTQIRQISKKKKSKSPDFNDEYQIT